jgi:hypothetical protein
VKLLKEQRQLFILFPNDDGYDHETQAYLNVGQRNWHVNAMMDSPGPVGTWKNSYNNTQEVGST